MTTKKQISITLSETGINPEDGVIYMSGDPANPILNNWRVRSVGVFLCFERYSGSEWVEQFQTGGSVVIPGIVEIIKEAASGDVIVTDETGTLIIAKMGVFDRGMEYGDLGGDTIIRGLNDVFRATQEVPFVWAPVQVDDSEQYTGTLHYVELTTTPGNGFVTEKIELSPVSIPADNIVQLSVYALPDTTNPVWQNVSDEELADGVGATIDPTSGEVDFKPNFTGIPDTDLRVSVRSITNITLKGSTTDGTDIYMRTWDSDTYKDSIVAFPLWKEGISYTIGDLIFQDREVHMVNVAGAQSTDFATNIAKWDKPLSKDEMYKARISAYLTTATLVLDGTEQLIAFDAEKWSRDITNISGVFTIATKGYYSGFITLHLITTGFATVIVWVECKPFGGSWQLLDGSMIKFSGNVDFSGSIPLNGGFDLGVGDEVRIKIKKLSGTASLQAATETVALGSLSQPAAALTFVRNDNIIPTP